MHFRNVQTAEYKASLDLPNAPFNKQFLEPLIDDEPKGLWSIQRQANGRIVTVRSLHWPGYCFFHQAGTKKFGSVYIGEGLKNDQLHFMI